MIIEYIWSVFNKGYCALTIADWLVIIFVIVSALIFGWFLYRLVKFMTGDR